MRQVHFFLPSLYSFLSKHLYVACVYLYMCIFVCACTVSEKRILLSSCHWCPGQENAGERLSFQAAICFPKKVLDDSEIWLYIDLIDRVPDELWNEVRDIVQQTGIKTIPIENKCKKQNGCLGRPYKQLCKEEKQKAKEKRKDINI